MKDDEIATLRMAVNRAELAHAEQDHQSQRHTQLADQIVNWEQQLHNANTLSMQRLVGYNEECQANKQLSEACQEQQMIAMGGRSLMLACQKLVHV